MTVDDGAMIADELPDLRAADAGAWAPRSGPPSMIIAIDGPAASGKGTLAKRLAAHYGLPHLDTGLLYRAVARALLDDGRALTEVAAATIVAARARPRRASTTRACAGGEMGDAASVVSAFQPVRDALLDLQRRFAAQPGGAVLDGRDIGTVVCPNAEAKLFVTAAPGGARAAPPQRASRAPASPPSSRPSSPTSAAATSATRPAAPRPCARPRTRSCSTPRR